MDIKDVQRTVGKIITISLLICTFCLWPYPSYSAPTDKSDSCSAVNIPQTWTPSERWVWNSLCLYDYADFTESGAPTDRVISDEFLDTIIEVEPYRSALHGTIFLTGAHFTDPVNLEYVAIMHPLWLQYCVFDDEVDLKGVRAPDLSLLHSEFAGRLDLSDIRIEQSVEIDEAIVHQGVDLSDATIGGHFSAGDGRLESIDASDATINSYVDLDGVRGQYIDLSNSALGDRLDLSGSHVDSVKFVDTKIDRYVSLKEIHSSTLDLSGSTIGRSLFLRSGAVIRHFNLDSTTIGGQVDINDSRLIFLSAYGLNVGQQLFFTSSSADRVRLDESSIGGSLEFTNATLKSLVLSGSTIGGQLWVANSTISDNCQCDHLHVNGDVSARDSNLGSSLSLSYLETHGNIALTGGSFDFVDLSAAHASGDLVVNARNKTIWRNGGTLILRNASTHAIEDRSKSCPTVGPKCFDPWPQHLDLVGFSYQQLGTITQNRLADALSAKRGNAANANGEIDIANRDVSWWDAWLNREQFSMQPYEQLASTLRQLGRSDEATQLLYDGKTEESAQTSHPTRAFLFLDRIFVGYGYYPHFALYWTLSMVGLGVLVLNISGERRRILREQSGGENDPFPVAGFVYSFDMLVPLVTLRKADEDVQLNGWARYYFYGHRLLGFILASFLAAAISGLTK